MSTHISAAIEIGGALRDTDVRFLCNAITEEHLSAEWGGAEFEPGSADDLLDVIRNFPYGISGRLWLCDDQSAWGEFPILEKACRRLGLSYARFDSSDEFDAGRVDWRPSMSKPLWRYCSVRSEKQVMVSEKSVRRALTFLKKKNTKDAIRILTKLCPNIPPLPPFRIVETTKRKRTRT